MTLLINSLFEIERIFVGLSLVIDPTDGYNSQVPFNFTTFLTSISLARLNSSVEMT